MRATRARCLPCSAGMRSSRAVDEAFDRLQEYLLAMTPGDEISVRRAAEISGLATAQCDAVLTALLRAGLLMRLQHDAYVRCRLKLTESQAASLENPRT